ncbi:hypothetical protein COLO4_33432 [Corchorus olitorius]|uniref:Uncharacterized protein n=1 Tax=Corchorus olitorius TaxID=93759 RepID=A0A1R3GTP0_9ROSI|nr:hypothetical protein COLO4_33432 [Corchorus olitorius]
MSQFSAAESAVNQFLLPILSMSISGIKPCEGLRLAFIPSLCPFCLVSLLFFCPIGTSLKFFFSHCRLLLLTCEGMSWQGMFNVPVSLLILVLIVLLQGPN